MFTLITVVSVAFLLLVQPSQQARDCDYQKKHYTHNQVFTTDSSGPCIKYRCTDGSVKIESLACQDGGNCVPFGTKKTTKCGQNASGQIGFFPVA